MSTSRDHEVWLVLGDPDPVRTTCRVCGFDSVTTYPVFGLSLNGVTIWHPMRTCGRCNADRRRREEGDT